MTKLYHEIVYYPFIQNIRRVNYKHDLNKKDIPDNLQADSWMDSYMGQLHLMGQETVLDYESKMKITANKQSPARTAVEQAADVGAMFKIIRYMIKSIPGGEVCNSHIYHLLVEAFEELEKLFIDN